jgi:hypothetical protein
MADMGNEYYKAKNCAMAHSYVTIIPSKLTTLTIQRYGARRESVSCDQRRDELDRLTDTLSVGGSSSDGAPAQPDNGQAVLDSWAAEAGGS